MVQQYLGVCARISVFDNFNGHAAHNGVCLWLIFSGEAGGGLQWSIRVSKTLTLCWPTASQL